MSTNKAKCWSYEIVVIPPGNKICDWNSSNHYIKYECTGKIKRTLEIVVHES